MVMVVRSVQYLFCEKTSDRKEEEEELNLTQWNALCTTEYLFRVILST